MFKTTINWPRKHKPPCKNSTQTCKHMHVCTHAKCESYAEYTETKLNLDAKIRKHKSGVINLNQLKYDSISKNSNYTVGRR